MLPDRPAITDIRSVRLSIIHTEKQSLAVAIEIGRVPTAIVHGDVFQLDQLSIGLRTESGLQMAGLQFEEHEGIVVVEINQCQDILGDLPCAEHDLKLQHLRRVREIVVGLMLMTEGGVRGPITSPCLFIVGKVVGNCFLRAGRTHATRFTDALRLVEIGVTAAMSALTGEFLAFQIRQQTSLVQVHRLSTV